jgi:hypothetical protein
MMTAAMTGTDAEEFDASAVEETVAVGLAAHGIEVRTPTSEKCCFLRVMNVPSTVADLTVWRNGIADLDYHVYDGDPHNPSRLAAVTLAVLSSDDASADLAGTGRLARFTGMDNVGRVAAEHGLAVASGLLDPDDDSSGACTVTTIAHPDRPNRGTVRIVDDGGLWWRCQVSDQPDSTDGLDLAEITAIIGRALTSASAI